MSVCLFSLALQNSLEGEVINPEFVVFNDTGPRFELLMKVRLVHM